MGAAIRATPVYFILVFVPAFAFGVFRTLILAPRLGPAVAVLIEAPVILTLSWFAARWCVRRFGVTQAMGVRLLMGLAAYALLMAVEFAFAVAVFGQSPAGYAASLQTTPGVLGITAQLGFALIPMIQAAVSRSSRSSA